MKVYKVKIHTQPCNFTQWFDDQDSVVKDGIRADTALTAQRTLDSMCERSGTDKDPLYATCGPSINGFVKE